MEKLYKTGLPIGGTEEEGIPVNMINGGWQEIYNWGTSAQQAKKRSKQLRGAVRFSAAEVHTGASAACTGGDT